MRPECSEQMLDERSAESVIEQGEAIGAVLVLDVKHFFSGIIERFFP